MKTKVIGFLIPALLAPALLEQTMFGQATQDRVIHLTHVGTIQEFQEIANAVRTTTEIRDVSTDNAQMSVTVHGDAEQVKLAEWLLMQLDQPAGGTIVPASPEYKGLPESVNGQMTQDGVARIFYLPHAATVQDFQEAANATRTITEIRRMFTVNVENAVLVRGTADQVAMAGWMLQELDDASNVEGGPKPARVREYRAANDDLMRVFYLANPKTVQNFQEIANAIRTTAEIRRVFACNTPRAMAVRGTQNEIAMATWLVEQLDKPADVQLSQASPEFQVPGGADDVMRVFQLFHTSTAQEFQQEATQIRTTLQIRRLFTTNAQRALAVRGTASQLALAANMVREMEQANSPKP